MNPFLNTQNGFFNDPSQGVVNAPDDPAYTNIPNGGPSAIPKAPAAIPQAQGPKPSWWEKLLPTAGSILGGIGGTVISPFLGSVAGAGLGGAAGKALENALTGQSALQTSDLTSGAMGAGGQALGFGAGSILGKLGGTLFGKAAQTGTEAAGQSAADIAGQGAADVATAAPRTGGILQNLESRLFQGQFAKGTVSRTLSDNINKTYGISDATQIPQIASTITGSAQGGGAALNKGVEQALMKAGPRVDVSGLYSDPLGGGMANDLVNSETSVGNTAGAKVLGNVNKAIQNMMGGVQGSVGDQLADPLDVLQQSRVFSRLAAQAADKGYGMGGVVSNPEQAGISRIYSNLADELNSRVFTPNGQDLALPDAVKADVIKGLSPIQDINPETYAKLADEVQGTNTVAGLRGLQAKWVGINQAFNKTADIADMSGGLTTSEIARGMAPLAGAVAGGPAGLAAGVAPAVLKSSTIDRGLAGGLNMLNRSASGGILDTLGQGVRPAMGALGAGGANLTNLVPAQGNNINLSTNMPGGTNSKGIGDIMNPASNNIFASNSAQLAPIQMMLMAGMFDPSMMGQFAPGAEAAFNKLQGAQNVASQLGNLYAPGGEFAQAGGAQGPIRGLLSELGARITGGPAASYQNQAAQLQQALASASGLPAGAISLPSLQQGQAGAQTSLANVQSLLAALGAGTTANPASAMPAQ